MYNQTDYSYQRNYHLNTINEWKKNYGDNYGDATISGFGKIR